MPASPAPAQDRNALPTASLLARLGRSTVWPQWALLCLLMVVEALPLLRKLLSSLRQVWHRQAAVSAEPQQHIESDPGVTLEQALETGVLQVLPFAHMLVCCALQLAQSQYSALLFASCFCSTTVLH